MNHTQKRFIVLKRHGFYLTTASATNELQPIIELKKVKTLRTMKCGALVVLTTDEIAASINLASRKFIVEEDVLHFPSVRCVTDAFRFSDPLLQKAVELSAAQIPLKCKVQGPENEPVEAAEVVFQCVVTGIAFKGKTNTRGIAEVNVIGKTFRILVFPHHGYWSKDGGIYDAENNDMAIIQLERLYAPGTYDWGHIAMEAHLVESEFRGQGIKVGIIDTGIQADPPHEDLRVARGLNCVTGDFPDNQERAPNSWKDDVDQHGSHCAGIVAALENEIGITGHAPQASLFGYKVFPRGYGASSADIADAIDFAIEDGVDVINLSLGARTKSITVEQAIQRAFEAGIVCCCAAGNDNSTVSYPAALNVENVVSVAGIGK
ncbi:MAG: S8 family serine peptidase, partial [Candidatus Omnitrophica bacterium]|nr:S8 family serine peptidase [Candidatus Omnitrophota bacterium]